MLREAFKFMWYDKAKMFGILFGIVLSVFLIGQQLGICFSLLAGTTSLVENNQQYIWVVSQKSQQVGELPLLDMRIARELMSVYGVKRVNPIVVSAGSAKFQNGKKATISIIGTSSPTFAGGPWKIKKGSILDLQQEGAITTDELSSSVLNNVQMGDRFEVNGQKVFVAAQTRGAKGLGLVYTFTTIQSARKLSKISSDRASAFLVEWENGVNPERVIYAINKEIPNIKAWSGKGFTNETLKYVATSSGIVASFGLLVGFAIITGLAIVGLTMYSAVNDRIKDYGTIKAIGGNNGIIRRIILWQAIIYSVVGFLIAYALLIFFVKATSNSLDIQLTVGLIAFLISITLFIALVSSLFGMRKITKLEPVEIFRM